MNTNNEISDLVVKAYKHQKNGDLSLAIQGWNALINHSSTDKELISNAFLNLGNLHLQQGNGDLAYESMAKAISANPNSSEAFFCMAYMEQEKENFNEAINFFEAAHKLKALPESPKGNFNKSYYDLLTINKSLLAESLAEEEIEINKPKGGRSNINALRELLLTKDIRHNPQYTDDQRNYIQRVIDEINSGGMTKRLAKEAYEEIKKPDIASNPIKLFSKLKNIISEDDLTDDNNQKDETLSKKEVILSEFYN